RSSNTSAHIQQPNLLHLQEMLHTAQSEMAISNESLPGDPPQWRALHRTPETAAELERTGNQVSVGGDLSANRRCLPLVHLMDHAGHCPMATSQYFPSGCLVRPYRSVGSRGGRQSKAKLRLWSHTCVRSGVREWHRLRSIMESPGPKPLASS